MRSAIRISRSRLFTSKKSKLSRPNKAGILGGFSSQNNLQYRNLCWNRGYQLFVPIGFAHGFVTLEPNSEIVYQCSDYYCPLSEGSVSWCDRDLGIEWPKVGELTINIKDRKALPLKSIDSPFLYGVNS